MAAFAASLVRRAFLARRYALSQTAEAERSELPLTKGEQSMEQIPDDPIIACILRTGYPPRGGQ